LSKLIVAKNTKNELLDVKDEVDESIEITDGIIA
jgi:hypothetical protein